jgi:hypothetical protein
VLEVVSTMQNINDSSKKIANIIGVIDGIAKASNSSRNNSCKPWRCSSWPEVLRMQQRLR